MEKIIVKKEEENNRIDAYLSTKIETASRVTIQRLIEEGKILVNNKKTKASYKIQEKDEVIVEEDKPKEVSIKAQNIPIEILYEDNDIIVVNKPKGLVVHPANGNPDGTLVNAIMAICKGTLSGIGGELRPGIVHRLDKDTSGVLIVAKNDIAHVKMSEQIKKHEVEKTYIALVKGIVQEKEIDKKILQIAEKLGIKDILNKYPYQVSGGQKQRCASARAIVNSPKLILADEPTGSLDSKSARQLLEIMEDMNQKMKATILMVTHDPLSASYCSKILFLKDGKIFNRIEKEKKKEKNSIMKY